MRSVNGSTDKIPDHASPRYHTVPGRACLPDEGIGLSLFMLPSLPAGLSSSSLSQLEPDADPGNGCLFRVCSAAAFALVVWGCPVAGPGQQLPAEDLCSIDRITG